MKPKCAAFFSLIALLLIVLSATNCRSSASTNPSEYVGEYVLRPSSAAPGQFASFVVLRKDHTAVEVRFVRDTGQILTTEKKWYLSLTTGENVVIGDFSHPIEASRSMIKLAIDLGQYYEKGR